MEIKNKSKQYNKLQLQCQDPVTWILKFLGRFHKLVRI